MPITQNGVELTVEISEKAAGQIRYFARKEGIIDNVGLRVAVQGGGSGLTYDLLQLMPYCVANVIALPHKNRQSTFFLWDIRSKVITLAAAERSVTGNGRRFPESAVIQASYADGQIRIQQTVLMVVSPTGIA